MSWDNLMKDQSIIPQMSSKPFFLDYVLILLLLLDDDYFNYLTAMTTIY